MLKGVVVTGNQEFLDSQLFKICLVLNDVKKVLPELSLVLV
jgi:hypothetical protein